MRLLYITSFVFAAFLCCGCGSQNSFSGSKDPQELEQLKGTWRVAAIEKAGQPMPPQNVQALNIHYIFEGDKFTIRRFAKPDIVSTISVDAGANPKKMLIHSSPPVRAIYGVEGTRLRFCLMVDENPNAGFPSDFVSRASPKVDLVTLERGAAAAPGAGLVAPAPPPGIPGETVYVYSQSTGKLSLNEQVICAGYSGKGEAKNNHAKQAEKDGPIPVGEYMLTGFRDSRKLGRKIMALLPVAGKSDHFKRFPRETFAFIDDSAALPSGCFIVVTRDVLQKLAPFNATLRVVE
jgi:uncharacterized protein (TIGR03067 family)